MEPSERIIGIVSRYRRFETAMQRSVESGTAPSCQYCDRRCCKELCDNVHFSAWFRLVMGKQADLYDAQSGYHADERGCLLEFGRAPGCYNLDDCAQLAAKQPNDLAFFTNSGLSRLLFLVGSSFWGGQAIWELDALNDVPSDCWDRFERKLEIAENIVANVGLAPYGISSPDSRSGVLALLENFGLEMKYRAASN